MTAALIHYSVLRVLFLSLLGMILVCRGYSQNPFDGSFQMIWNDEFSGPATTNTVNLFNPLDQEKWFNEWSDWKRNSVSNCDANNPCGNYSEQASMRQAFRGYHSDPDVLNFNTQNGYLNQVVVKEKVTVFGEDLPLYGAGTPSYWSDPCCVSSSNPANGICPPPAQHCNPPYIDFDSKAPTWLRSRDAFKYGYFETRIKLPPLPAIPSGPNSSNHGIGANFWLFTTFQQQHCNPNVTYSEIDIFEFIGQDPSNNYNHSNHVLTFNRHYRHTPQQTPTTLAGEGVNNNRGSIDFSTWHTFACDWTPRFIRFYMDDILLYEDQNSGIASQLNPMEIILDINNGPTGEWYQQETLFPYVYSIDYVRVYNYNLEKCEVNAIECNPLSLDPSVYKSISLGGAGCNENISVNTYLKANDGITLNENLAFHAGSELLLDIVPCHSPEFYDETGN